MALKEELNALKPLFGTESPAFYERIKSIAETYSSEEDKKEIALFMDECIQETETGMTRLEELTIKMQLQEVSEIISLSWIAKKYFGKTKNWLYQRINGNTVNGKPCRFTSEEVETFNHALKDISQRIGSLSISY